MMLRGDLIAQRRSEENGREKGQLIQSSIATVNLSFWKRRADLIC